MVEVECLLGYCTDAESDEKVTRNIYQKGAGEITAGTVGDNCWAIGSIRTRLELSPWRRGLEFSCILESDVAAATTARLPSSLCPEAP